LPPNKGTLLKGGGLGENALQNHPRARNLKKGKKFFIERSHQFARLKGQDFSVQTIHTPELGGGGGVIEPHGLVEGLEIERSGGYRTHRVKKRPRVGEQAGTRTQSSLPNPN